MKIRDLKEMKDSFIETPISSNAGRIYSYGGGRPANWDLVRAGRGDNLLEGENVLAVGAGNWRLGNITYINRSFIQFELPSNLVRLDSNPKLKIYANSVSEVSLPIVISSIDYNDLRQTWVGGNARSSFLSAQVGAGASNSKYIDNSYASIQQNLYETISLNKLAKSHCTSDAHIYNGSRFFVVSIIEYTHDWMDSQPTDASNDILFDSAGDANPPLLVLNKPWFTDPTGDQKELDGDFTINSFKTIGGHKESRVEQLPFSSAIRGPANLRQRNKSYQVTRS